jgi:hypothetical protein
MSKRPGAPNGPVPSASTSATANDGALGEQHLHDFQDNEKTI